MPANDAALLTPEPGLSRSGTPTWEVAYLFPAQGTWDEAEYLSLGTNWMIEFEDGYVEVLPMPTVAHQLLVDFLVDRLKQFVREHTQGRVLFAPLPVKLWSGKYREPDVIYLSPDRVRATGDYPHGADLVMEVVREGAANRQRDLVAKPAEYARAGIQEYWIIDPERAVISVLALAGETYRLHGEFQRGTTASSVLLSGFLVKVDEAFAALDITESE